MEFKKRQGKVERDGERVFEPEKRTKGGEIFEETPRRYKEGETEAEVLREEGRRPQSWSWSWRDTALASEVWGAGRWWQVKM